MSWEPLRDWFCNTLGPWFVTASTRCSLLIMLASAWRKPSSTCFRGGYMRLDRLQSTLRVMFFDFSSTTVQPAHLAEKLSVMQMDQDLVAWITDYLRDRRQYVRLKSCRGGDCQDCKTLGNSAVTVLVHPLQLWDMASAEDLWWLFYCWLNYRQQGRWLQRSNQEFHWMVWQEPPATQHWENQRAGNGLLMQEEKPNTCFQKWGSMIHSFYWFTKLSCIVLWHIIWRSQVIHKT